MKDVRDSLGGAQGTGKTQKYVRVAPSFRYNAADCDYVLRIASQYALAYRDPNDNNSVFLPAMCRYGDKKPEDLCQPEKTAYRVVYELEYPYLSETVVQRLMLACLLRGYKKCLEVLGEIQMKPVTHQELLALAKKTLSLENGISQNCSPLRR